MRTAPADEDAPVAFRQGIEGRGSATRTCCRRQFETSTAADPMYTAMTGAGPNLKSEPKQDFVEVRAVVQPPPCGARQAIDNAKDDQRGLSSKR